MSIDDNTVGLSYSRLNNIRKHRDRLTLFMLAGSLIGGLALNDPTSSPKEWENYFKDIVRLHYKPANYCDVPDKHIGDFGIECFTLDGHVFQCYLPEQISDTKKLVEAQKGKIRDDIRKFTKDYVSQLKKLFGDLKISRWILATSCYESAELAQYCTQKSLKVRDFDLPYVADDFEILIHTEKEYPQEVMALRRDNYQLTLKFDSVSIDKASEWVGENSTFLEKLDLKVPKITDDASKGESTRSFLIQRYLEYENLLDNLRQDWGEIYQIIYTCISNREANLAGRFLVAEEPLPTSVIKEEIEKLRSDVSNEINTIKGTDLEKITWGVIADWLIRCPLDF